MQSSSKEMPAISFQNVGVRYPPAVSFHVLRQKQEGFWGIKDVSFQIYRGDVLGIVGANGAGKSTTLKVIGGIIAPDRGTVNIFQNTVTLLSINAGLAPYLSGRTNIFLIGLSLGIARARIREVIDEIVEFSELEEFIDQPVQTYSSGMKSKLGFSTAMFLRPNILLIDEILGVGDRAFRKKSSKAIREKLSGNATAILVTHNEAEIKKHCNKALWIEKGRSIAFGTPKEVLKEYDLHYK